ncbi:MAG: cation:proton antiporter, partial [Cyanobacteria bacterium P01_E01_bin.45]
PKAVFLGAVLSLSSTAVVLKSLLERNEVNSAHGQIMLAILIVQDLGLGILLAVLPVLTRPPEEIGTALLIALFKVTAFLICAIMAGKWVIPRLVRTIARQGSQELFLLGILGLCLGIALITSAIGLGIEMGAFVAGVMVSNVEYADHALDRVLPMRDVFATLFFASIGLLIDPLFLLENIWVLAGLVAIAMVGKALILTSIVRVFGYPLRTALTVGMGLNQIGEFSFVLAGVAQTSGVFTERLYGLVVGTTAVTLLLTPFVLRLTPRLLLWMERSPSLNPLLQAKSPTLVGFEENELTDHVIVAGFGRVGQTLVRMLDFQQHPILVIDNDEGVLQSLRDRKIPYLLGDVSSMLVLEKANLSKARTMAITLPDPMATRLTLNRALSLAPDLDITVRAHVNVEIDTLYHLGAQEVVQPEFEAALEMGAHTLLKLGDSAYMVQQLVNRYRNRRYRDIIPRREEYWGSRQLELAVEGLDHRWYELDDRNFLVGQTIVESNLRKLTGATIIAIERKNRLRRYPLGSTTFKAGDRLLVVGNPEEQDAFNQLFHEVKA